LIFEKDFGKKMALLAAAVDKIRYCFVGEESLKEHMCVSYPKITIPVSNTTND